MEMGARRFRGREYLKCGFLSFTVISFLNKAKSFCRLLFSLFCYGIRIRVLFLLLFLTMF